MQTQQTARQQVITYLILRGIMSARDIRDDVLPEMDRADAEVLLDTMEAEGEVRRAKPVPGGVGTWYVVERPETINDDQIRALRNEAREAGDEEQVSLCTEAMHGDNAARAECARVIAEARARQA